MTVETLFMIVKHFILGRNKTFMEGKSRFYASIYKSETDLLYLKEDSAISY